MEFQARTELEGPGEAVSGDFFAFDHLTLRLQIFVDAVERVPDESGRVADDILRTPNRVEIGEVGLRHKA